jgi:hypothetical protein
MIRRRVLSQRGTLNKTATDESAVDRSQSLACALISRARSRGRHGFYRTESGKPVRTSLPAAFTISRTHRARLRAANASPIRLARKSQ